MTWPISIALLLVSVSTVAIGQLTSGIDDDARAPEFIDFDAPHELGAEPDSTASDSDPQNDTETAHQEASVITPSNRETPDTNDVSDGTPSKSVAAAPISLDELLRQIHQTPRLQHEATLARLAERKRLAIAIHSTLEAAEQVADFGRAGTELLNDASLDTVVATMIAQQENKLHEQKQPSVATGSTVPSVQTLPNDASTSKVDKQGESGFDDWRPAYVVKDSRGHRIGWRHVTTDTRAVTYVGEQWRIGPDTVTVVAVATDVSGRYLVVDVNGEQREVHFF